MLPLNIRLDQQPAPVVPVVGFPVLLLDAICGFVLGLLTFVGVMNIIVAWSDLAGAWVTQFGFRQSTFFGLVAAFAPYIVLVVLFGLAIRQLLSMSSRWEFAYFALALATGFLAVYVGLLII